MTTIYIKGRPKCKKVIRKALLKSKLDEGDHYIEGANQIPDTILYWITSRITLREFKQSIGAKVIWEYRLQFIEDVEELIEKESEELTDKERELLNRFKILKKINLLIS